MKRISVVCIATVLTVAASIGVQNSKACSCIDYQAKEAYGLATHVFVGKVTQIDHAPAWYLNNHPENHDGNPVSDPERALQGKWVTLDVQDVYKGKVPSSTIVVTSKSEAYCGVPFMLDKQYLVYAYADDNLLFTNYCMRTMLREKADADIAVIQALSK